MATEMINLKLDSKFLKEIDALVKEDNYQNRTEFIREALRKGLDDAKMKKAMAQLAPFKGAAKKKVTEEEYEYVREHILDHLK